MQYTAESKTKTFVIALPWTINISAQKCSGNSPGLKLQLSLTACQIECERDVTSSGTKQYNVFLPRTGKLS